MELERLRERYRGSRARNYDRDRVETAEWQREQAVVESFLHDTALQSDDVVLDIPVGTGRFLEFYKRLGCRVVGLDISDEMLEQAVVRSQQLSLDAQLGIGDITKIDAGNSSAKVVVCVRILNLLDFDNFRRALGEAARVSSKYVIAGIQVRRSATNESWWRRLRRPRNVGDSQDKNRFTEPHPEALVLRELRKRRLTVVRRELIVDSKSTPYYLFLLEKSR